MSEPVPPRERNVTLDVLRGFALFGVLVANLFVLYSMRVAQTEPEHRTDYIDVAAGWFMRIVVHGRAQTLLTLLFGFGFAIQLLRAEQRGERFLPIYLRRVAALFVIGWFHVVALAWVDVTWGYAIAALFLLPFMRASNRTRIVAAALLIATPTILYSIESLRPTLHTLLFAHPPPYYIQRFAAAVREGDRIAIIYHNIVMALLWGIGGNWLWYYPWLVGRFLLGYVAGAKRWFDRESDHLHIFHRMFVIGFAGTLPNLAVAVFGFRAWEYEFGVAALGALIYEVGVLSQTLMFIAIVVLVMQRPTWRKVLGILAPVGRMPLTTYLMQSLICTHLFYGFGLNWSTPSPAACIALSCAIFAVQIVFAHLWLRWFLYGPFEWLWRTVVYWRRQPMLGSSAV
jgi:uncharacterized protein